MEISKTGTLVPSEKEDVRYEDGEWYSVWIKFNKKTSKNGDWCYSLSARKVRSGDEALGVAINDLRENNELLTVLQWMIIKIPKD